MSVEEPYGDLITSTVSVVPGGFRLLAPIANGPAHGRHESTPASVRNQERLQSRHETSRIRVQATPLSADTRVPVPQRPEMTARESPAAPSWLLWSGASVRFGLTLARPS